MLLLSNQLPIRDIKGLLLSCLVFFHVSFSFLFLCSPFLHHSVRSRYVESLCVCVCVNGGCECLFSHRNEKTIMQFCAALFIVISLWGQTFHTPLFHQGSSELVPILTSSLHFDRSRTGSGKTDPRVASTLCWATSVRGWEQEYRDHRLFLKTRASVTCSLTDHQENKQKKGIETSIVEARQLAQG